MLLCEAVTRDAESATDTRRAQDPMDSLDSNSADSLDAVPGENAYAPLVHWEVGSAAVASDENSRRIDPFEHPKHR